MAAQPAEGPGNCSNASNLSNCSNATAFVCTKPLTCCKREIRLEAKLACKEYESLGATSDQSCRFWEDYAAAECEDQCEDCQKIARMMKSSCLFALQAVMSFAEAIPHCLKTEETFLKHRCPSACIEKIPNCYTDEYERCNALCGNYNYAPGIQRDGCGCSQRRTDPGMPDFCFGQTILSGFVAGGGGVKHSCSLMPDDCRNHRPTTCGFYKHCPVDVCVVRNISCPFRDSCESNGVCGKSDGQCYYQPKPDGESCDDGFVWTHSDSCMQGRCKGIANKCMRDSVNCSTANPCLRVTDKVSGGCDPGTGHCVFEQLPEGTACASRADPSAGGAEDGQCMGGLCRRSLPVGDPCRNLTCSPPNPCYEVPPCIPGSGCGTPSPLPEGARCDDGNAATHGDRCIEGRCVGDVVAVPAYRELGSCAGQPPQAGGGAPLPWRRYSADVPDLQDCKNQCNADPECRAFSYGYQTCSIFGTSRLRDPDAAHWGRTWLLETADARPQHSVSCYAKGGEPFWLSLSDSERTLLMVSICFVVLLPVAWLTFVGWRPLRSSLGRLLNGGQESDEVAGAFDSAPPSPGGGGTKVAAAPGPLAEQPYDGQGSMAWDDAPEHVPDPRGEVSPSNAQGALAVY